MTPRSRGACRPDDAVRKLLWPEQREDRTCQEEWGLPFCPPVYRTTEESYLRVRTSTCRTFSRSPT